MAEKRKHSSPPAKVDDREQSKLFIKKAREIKADEDRSGADELLGRLARMPPQPHQKAPRKKHDDQESQVRKIRKPARA